MTTYPTLFSPGMIAGRQLKNRIIMSLFPTKMGSEGKVTEQMLEWYKARAKGGAAAIVVESVSIDYPRAYKGGRQLRIDTPEHRSSVSKLIDTIHFEGALAILHTSYSSKMAWGNVEKKQRLVEALSVSDIDDLVDKWSLTAKQAQQLGFDGIEVQASYGDLLSTFLSPHSNHRADAYGGNLENRSRFLLRVVQACREAAGEDFIIQIKYMADEYLPGGFSSEDGADLAPRLQAAGASAIVVSGGGSETKALALQPYTIQQGVHVNLAGLIRSRLSIPVIAMGKIKDPDLAETAIASGKADFVAMTRALLADPDWPAKLAAGKPESIRGCIGCLECSNSRYDGRRLCTVNPWVGREGHKDRLLRRASVRKKVMVAGGGPAGMQAALISATRGHEVVIYEREATLGGLWKLASSNPLKREIAELTRYQQYELDRLGVQKIMGRMVQPGDVEREAPDVLILATGSSQIRFNIKGAEYAADARDVLSGKVRPGLNVVVIGGGDTGSETAEFLLEQGHSVMLISRDEKIAPDLPYIVREDLLSRLAKLGAVVMAGATATEVRQGSVVIDDRGGPSEIPCDTAILAVGEESVQEGVQGLMGEVDKIVVVGDAIKPGNALEALISATNAVLDF